MINLTSPSWWTNQLISTFITLIFIFIIKKVFEKVNVPVVSDIIEQA